MKIAIITPGGVDRGGTERVIPCLLWFIERLVRSGDEVHVFALRQERARAEWPLLGAIVHNAGGGTALTRGTRVLRDLRREHRRARFDIIHALWAVPQGLWAAIASKLLRVPLVLHLPGGDLARIPEVHYGNRLKLRGRLALRLAIWGADRVLTLSEQMVRSARELGIHVNLAPFGIALDHWPPREPQPRNNDAPASLLHVADLSPIKDQETLLLAMDYLRRQSVSFVLEIAGGDTLEGVVQRRVRQLGLEACVGFLGFLPQDALRRRVCDADILIVTSRHEAGPVVALEAAACGVPTVGTRVGLLADWAPDAARVVDTGDAHGLAAAVIDLLSCDEERVRLARQAQLRAIACDADVTTERIRAIYREAIDAGMAPRRNQAAEKASPRRRRNS